MVGFVGKGGLEWRFGGRGNLGRNLGRSLRGGQSFCGYELQFELV